MAAEAMRIPDDDVFNEVDDAQLLLCELLERLPAPTDGSVADALDRLEFSRRQNRFDAGCPGNGCHGVATVIEDGKMLRLGGVHNSFSCDRLRQLEQAGYS
ncbi:MAG TPA: hypothetical protein VJJ83_05200 [Candidatus Babeliales bacterium]|nr:hypothetical protein [Candidatus Babeliales bacterium]